MKRPKNLKATEIPKPVRNDKLCVIASEPGRVRQSGSGFYGLLRRSFITPRNDGRIFAFTLAEVLITLVIIGVIAALTIPNLMQKYTEQETVKKVQKFYSNLSNAYNLASKDNGPASDWGLTTNDKQTAEKIYKILIEPYFKISKNCGTSNIGNCVINTKYKNNNNEDEINYGVRTDFYKVILDDGSAIFWRGIPNSTTRALIYIDVNAIKAPNRTGHDLFYFAIENDKLYPYGTPIYNGVGSFPAHPTAWVIYKGNMDYLHCNDLSWDGKDKCSK